MDISDLFGGTLQHFIAEMYASGASLLSGKLGKKVFRTGFHLKTI